MATRSAPLVPLGGEPPGDAAMQHPHWRKAWRLSSAADAAERWLEQAGFDRAPWLAVALGLGIAAWFVLPGSAWWLGFLALAAGVAALAGVQLLRGDRHDHLWRAALALAVAVILGMALVWAKSALAGAPPIAAPQVSWIDGRVLAREDRGAEGRVRLTLAYRDDASGLARKVRVNVPLESAPAAAVEGARVRLRARLMPPAPPMVPGAYDFARTAWFAGLAATGSAIGAVQVTDPVAQGGVLAETQRSLARHVRSRLTGTEGAIAAAFASGDRGAIPPVDEEVMRDSGLTHLLSISGLHVSAVIAGAYLLALRLLALWPWLALRVRLPLAAAACGALAGVGYTLLTGAEVPTVRSCLGALLVLAALALGREALSMRMVAAAAAAVLMLWPEAIVTPSFQMSFAAVTAIVALHESAAARAFLAPRAEHGVMKLGRRLAMLLITGVVIELALMPIVLFHFHRAGFYGALANVVAIPLVTFITMPAIAAGLALDLVGLGAPAWWVVQQSLWALLAIARFTAGQPGAVKLMPQIGAGTFALFLAGLLWLALWHGRRRLLGFVPVAVASAMLLATPVPDLLVSGDGRHVGIAGEGDRLLVLREGRSDFARDNLLEMVGMAGDPIPLSAWPGARCSSDFCSLSVRRDGRDWSILMARSRTRTEERALAAACDEADIVIADRWLPASCRPRWLKADRRTLGESGGLSVYLTRERVDAVADSQGQHPWWTARINGAAPRARPVSGSGATGPPASPAP